MEDIKMLKRLLKNRIKITDSLIVMFLITKSVIYSTELLNIGSIYFNNGEVEEIQISDTKVFSIDSKEKIDGEIKLDLVNPLTDGISIVNNGYILPKDNKNGIFFDNRTLESGTNSRDITLNKIGNNGVILAEESLNTPLERVQSGNGIFIFNIDNMLNIKEVLNTGTVSGYYKSNINKSNSGNGIVLIGKTGSLDTFENIGIIKGEGTQEFLNSNFGNGVYISLDSVSSIKNSGLISGKAIYPEVNPLKANAGYGMHLAATIGSFENTGVISGYQEHASNLGGLGVDARGIEDFKNTGVISGTTGTGEAADKKSNGYAIGLDTGLLKKDNFIENSGIIAGRQSNSVTSGHAGYGIMNNLGEKKRNIKNSGIILGYEEAETFFSGANNSMGGSGVVATYQTGTGKIDIYNTGIISGYNSIGGKRPLYYNPGGIALLPADLNSNIVNNGVVKSNISAISIAAYKGTSKITNNGIFAGKNIIDIHDEYSDLDNVVNNNGIFIYLNDDESIKMIENGKGGEVVLEDGTTKMVINGVIDGSDSFIVAKNGENYKNNIINAAGIEKGALIIEGDSSMDDSIVNAHNTAIYLENGSNLKATNTIINGGGLKGEIAVIKGDSGANEISILGESIINGSVDLGSGDDILAIGNSVQINGNLDGGIGNDKLNLGAAEDNNRLTLFHEINGFENITMNNNITLFETAKVTGAENIVIESGELVLRVDPTISIDGKVTGHALYENEGILSSTGGKLVIGLNGIGAGATVSMGGTTITSDTNDSWWKDSDYIKTNSLVLDGKLSEDGKDIYITVLESIPLEPSIPIPPIDPEPPIDPPIVLDSLIYEKLNQVYQSIVSAGEIGALANTTLLEDKTYNESLGGLLTILDQVYSNNPYSYTLKSSRDSLKLFEDNMSYLTIKPKESEMIVQGRAIYTGVRNDSIASGKNYYGFDTGHRNYKTTTSTTGGLATLEYGLSDETSVGVILGGNNQDIKFRGTSKIKGNSLYLGTFVKKDIENFKIMSGIGYQYTSADATRGVSNRYDSFSTGDKYDINSLNLFAEAKYVYTFEQGVSIEPKVRLSYYHIDQEAVNEGYRPGQISMKADSAESDTVDVEIGVDFVKSLYTKSGKLKNILSLGVINSVGDTSKEMSGYILGKENDGKKFDIHGVEIPETSGKVAYNLELEQTNGMIYTAGVSLEFAKNYNRNLNTTLGIGYKF
ncbi:MAG: autotransporter domain-containing protein [Cetobacterium sp.]